jgi:hypothetical protein
MAYLFNKPVLEKLFLQIDKPKIVAERRQHTLANVVPKVLNLSLMFIWRGASMVPTMMKAAERDITNPNIHDSRFKASKPNVPTTSKGKKKGNHREGYVARIMTKVGQARNA